MWGATQKLWSTLGARGAGNKKKQKKMTRGNASSLTSLRPVPYTLHSFTCSHVDWSVTLTAVRFHLRVLLCRQKSILTRGPWDSHPCSAWSMCGNTKSKLRRLLGVCRDQLWVSGQEGGRCWLFGEADQEPRNP